MLKSRPIVAFVATTDPKRSKAFYAKTLGLHLVSEDGFALAFDAGGTMLRVAIVKALQPAGYTVLGWIVPDIAKAVRALLKRGVTFRRYEGMPQDTLGIWPSPSGARVAWFTDPEGNTLSLTQLERPTSTKAKRKRNHAPDQAQSPGPKRARSEAQLSADLKDSRVQNRGG
jgi:catechol 2,3-dioxygenase-like lactoylglutathione lyase family enzyme